MKGSHRIAISLLVSVALSSLIAVSAYAGLFDFIETRFFNNQIIDFYKNQGEVYTNEIDKFHENKLLSIETVFADTAIWRNYLSNQSLEVIKETKRSEQLIRDILDGFIGLRLLDGAGNIHFSTFKTDKRRETEYQIVYDKFESVQKAISLDDIYSGKNVHLASENDSAYIIYIIPVNDSAGVQRGYGLVYTGTTGLATYLIKAGISDIGKELKIIAPYGIIVNGNLIPNNDVLNIIQNKWSLDNIEESIQPIADNNERKLHIYQKKSEYGQYVGIIIQDSSFHLNPKLKMLLILSSCLSVFLLVFLLINLKQDDSVIFEARLKRFHESVFIEYLENQQSVSLDKWFRQLDNRKDTIKNNLLGSIKKKNRDDYEKKFDNSWEQLVSAFQDQTKSSSLPDTARLEELLSRVLQDQLQSKPIKIENVQRDGIVQSTNIEHPSKTTKGKKVEIAEADAVEEMGEIEEVETAEAVEEIEEIEEVSEAEAVEEIEEIEEVVEAESVEEIGSIEEVSEVGAVEEIEEIEEIAEAEAVEEIGEIEEVSEAEAVEEIEEIEDVAPTEETEEVDELDDAEPIDTAQSIEEIEEAEDQLIPAQLKVSKPNSGSAEPLINRERYHPKDFVITQDTSGIPVIEYHGNEYELIRIGTEPNVTEKPAISSLGYSMMNPETIIDDDEVLDLTALFSEDDDLGNIEVFEDSVEDIDAITGVLDEVGDQEVYDEGDEVEYLVNADEEEEIDNEISDFYINLIPLPKIMQEHLDEIPKAVNEFRDVTSASNVQELGRAQLYRPISRDFSYGLRGFELSHSGYDDAFESRNLFAELDKLITKLNQNPLCEIYHLSEVIINEDKKRISLHDKLKHDSQGKHYDLDLDITELVDTILPQNQEEDLSIDSILSKKSVDLTDGLDDDLDLDDDDTSIILTNIETNYLKMRGFDFDSYCSSFRQGTMSAVKGLMRISSKFNAFYAAILKFTDKGLRITQSLGMDSLSINQMCVNDDEDEMSIFKNNLIIYLRGGNVGIPFFDTKLVGRDQTYLKGAIYFPIIFNNGPAYLFLGLKNSSLNVEEWISILGNA